LFPVGEGWECDFEQVVLAVLDAVFLEEAFFDIAISK
jgi:hypothetical protein